MSQELSRLADGAGYRVLAYLLEMAREEAETCAAPSPTESEPAGPTSRGRPRRRPEER